MQSAGGDETSSALGSWIKDCKLVKLLIPLQIIPGSNHIIKHVPILFDGMQYINLRNYRHDEVILTYGKKKIQKEFERMAPSSCQGNA